MTCTYACGCSLCPIALYLQARDTMEKALAEDPSVFEYDTIYDEMENKKRESDPRLKSLEDRKVGVQ